jgi:hypothetical protein
MDSSVHSTERSGTVPQAPLPPRWLPQPSPAQRAWLKRVCTEALARRFAP